MFPRGVSQYAERYVEPLARELAFCFPRDVVYEHVVVVPARDEAPDFVQGYQAASKAAQDQGQRVLVVVVINGGPGAPEEGANGASFLELGRGGARRWEAPGEQAVLTRWPYFDLLTLDCFRGERALNERLGVGTARKIGCDFATLLIEGGSVRRPLLCCTDADAVLPPSYFSAPHQAWAARAEGQEPVVATIHPFIHTPGADAAVNAATELYELWLRYYVAGLRWAGSPYAFPTLGSTITMDVGAYRAVRGFSQRRAGEDYYTLDKLAKVGRVALLEGQPIELASRISARAPFGTGPAVQRILEQGESALAFHSPASFAALRAVLLGFSRFALSRDLGSFRGALRAGEALGADDALEALGAFPFLADAPHHAPSAPQLLRRLLGWFDGLRSLRFLNLLQDSRRSRTDAESALRHAAFIPFDPFLTPRSEQLQALRRAGGGGVFGVDRTVKRLFRPC